MYRNLKALRQSLNMSQKEFAASLGIGYTTYNGYETGARDPKSDFWITVAEKYGVTIDYLMGFSEDPHGYSPVTESEPGSESERQKRLDQLAKEINQSKRFLQTASDYTYNFFLKMRDLVGLDKQIPHDIYFRGNNEIKQLQSEIEERLMRFMETATQEEKEQFLLRLDRIGEEYHQRMDSLKPYNQYSQAPPEDKK